MTRGGLLNGLQAPTVSQSIENLQGLTAAAQQGFSTAAQQAQDISSRVASSLGIPASYHKLPIPQRNIFTRVSPSSPNLRYDSYPHPNQYQSQQNFDQYQRGFQRQPYEGLAKISQIQQPVNMAGQPANVQLQNMSNQQLYMQQQQPQQPQQFAQNPGSSQMVPSGMYANNPAVAGQMANQSFVPVQYARKVPISQPTGQQQMMFASQGDADARFRRSKELFAQAQMQKVSNQMAGSTAAALLDQNTKLNLAAQNQMMHQQSFNQLLPESQLAQFNNQQQQAPPALMKDPAQDSLARQSMYLSMDGGLNMIAQQKNSEMMGQNVFSPIDRGRAVDRLSLDQLYQQSRSRSADMQSFYQTNNMPDFVPNSQPVPVMNPAIASNQQPAQFTANQNLSLQQSQSPRFPTFPLDLAHKLHAQHAAASQFHDPAFDLKSGLSTAGKSVSFNTEKDSMPHRKLSELFPDCAECRRLEESRRLYRASMKLQRNNSESNWGEYMKENDRFISVQDEENLRKLAKMVSATFSGDSDSAESDYRNPQSFMSNFTSGQDPRFDPRFRNNRSYGSSRSLNSGYLDNTQDPFYRTTSDYDAVGRRNNSLSELSDMSRRLSFDEQRLTDRGRSRNASQDYLGNTEYAKAAAYAAELNQKLGAFTAEMDNLTLERNPRRRSRSRDKKSVDVGYRRISPERSTAAPKQRERSKTRIPMTEDINYKSKHATSPTETKLNRDRRRSRMTSDYPPVGGLDRGDDFDSPFQSRSRNRSSSRGRINNPSYEDTNSMHLSRRRASVKDRLPYEEEQRSRLPRDKSRDGYGRRASVLDNTKSYNERLAVLRDGESSSSSVDRMSSPDRRRRHGGGGGGGGYSQEYGSRRGDRSRDRNYDRKGEHDRRKLPDTPNNTNSNESGYSSQSQRASRDDEGRGRGSSRHRREQEHGYPTDQTHYNPQTNSHPASLRGSSGGGGYQHHSNSNHRQEHPRSGGGGPRAFLERVAAEEGRLRDRLNRAEDSLFDDLVPPEARESLKGTISRTKEVLEVKMPKSRQLCEMNLHQSEEEFRAANNDLFNYWADVQREARELEDQFYSIEQQCESWRSLTPTSTTASHRVGSHPAPHKSAPLH